MPLLPIPTDQTWWEYRVVSNLSPQQRSTIKGKGGDLAKLDFLGLLNVLDGNWNAIFQNEKEKYLVDQMKEVREVVQAHPTGEIIENRSAGDIYRHLDALGRFSEVIGRDHSITDLARPYKIKAAQLFIETELPREHQSGDDSQEIAPPITIQSCPLASGGHGKNCPFNPGRYQGLLRSRSAKTQR